jgi:hypothetical protein
MSAGETSNAPIVAGLNKFRCRVAAQLMELLLQRTDAFFLLEKVKFHDCASYHSMAIRL